MLWSLWIQVAAALLLLMVLTPTLQEPACDEHPFVTFPEYPGAIENTINISSTELYKYSSFFLKADSPSNFVRPNITYKSTEYPDLPPETFGVEFNGTGANGSGWYIQMLKGVDREGININGTPETINTLEYKIICYDFLDTDISNHRTLTVTITDINDNAPVFQQLSYQFFIDEKKESPYEIEGTSLITATDKDYGNNGLVEYTLLDSENRTTPEFKLASQDRGIILLARNQDYDQMVRDGKDPSYVLNLIATDKGINPLSGLVKVIINITDCNDLPPRFHYPSCLPKDFCQAATYDTSIASNTIQQEGEYLTFLPLPRDDLNPNQTVSILARDGDSLNAPLKCSIIGIRPANTIDETYFNVTTTQVGNMYRCNIRVVKPINRIVDTSASSDFTLTLRVEELTLKNYKEEALIYLHVIPENSFSPEIESGVGRIRETASIGSRVKTNDSSSILTLSVTDADGV